jgi:hypothetical protein
MAVNTRNSIVTNGLVLHLDAANLISFDSRNLLINTENFITSWAFVPFESIIQRTGSAAIAPDGTLSATEVYKESGTGLRQTSPFGFINTGDTMTFSVYAQAKSGSSSITLDIGDEGSRTSFINDTEWTRCSTTVTYRGQFTPNGANFVDITLPLTQSIYLWGAQWNFGQLIDYVPVGATIPPFKNLVDRTITGSLVNGPVYKNYNGGAIRFDGVNDIIQLSTTQSLTNNYTLRFLFETSRTSSSTDPYFTMLNGVVDSPINSMKLEWDNRFLAFNNSSPPQSYAFAFPIVPAFNLSRLFNDMQITVDDSNVMTIYNNGVACTPTTIVTGSLDFQVLGRGNGSVLESISIFSLYNRSLSQQEITQNYNATKSRFNLL